MLLSKVPGNKVHVANRAELRKSYIPLTFKGGTTASATDGLQVISKAKVAPDTN